MTNLIVYWQTASAVLTLLVIAVSILLGRRIQKLQKNNKQAMRQLHLESAKTQELRHKLGESKKFLHLIINGVPQGIFWKNRNSVYMGCNQTFAKAVGLETSAEIIGKTDYDLPWSPEAASYFHQSDRKCLQKDQPLLNLEATQLNFQGDITHFKTSRIPLHNSSDKIIGLLGTFEDITQQKKRNDSLRFIIEETASQIGQDFFPSCVQTLAEILDVDYAIIAENKEQGEARILALWSEQRFHPELSFSLAATPLVRLVESEVVIGHQLDQDPLLPQNNRLKPFPGYNFFGVAISDFQGKILGYLAILSKSPKTHQIAEYELILKIFANRASAEIQRQKSQKVLEHQLQRVNLLAQITRQIRSNLRVEDVFQSTVNSIAQVFGVNRCNLITYDKQSKGNVTAEYCETGYVSLLESSLSFTEHPYLEQTFTSESAISFVDIFQKPQFQPQQVYYQKIALKSLLVVRTSYQGVINGGIALHQCDRYRSWTPDEISLLESVADSVGIAIAQAQLLEREITRRIQLDSRNKQLQTEVRQRKETERALERQLQRKLLLNRITHEIRQNLDSETIFRTAATQIGQAFCASRCSIHTYLESSQPSIPLVAEYLEAGNSSLMGIKIPVLKNPHVQAMLNQDKAVVSADVFQDPLLENSRVLCRQIHLKSMLAVRTSYQNKANGCIVIQQCDHQREWLIEEIVMLEAVAAQVGIAIAQANLLEQEQQQRRELEQAKQKAEVANQTKSEFLAKMSHELRTPLNAILGFSQVMYCDRDTTTEQKETLSIINSSGEHLLSLISDILAMSKIESGKISLNSVECNFKDLLNSLYHMLSAQAEAKEIELSFELAENLPEEIRIDEAKLRQILINLLGNAMKFTHQGNVTLTVSAQEANSEYLLLFKVTDTGIGIAQEELSSLFQPFVQTKSGRDSGEGTGLGLAISQRFVQMLQGEITVQSELNRGTSFQFQLPVEVLNFEPSATDATKNDFQVLCLQPHQEPPKILIAEDRWENRLFLKDLLSSVGFDLQEVYNGQEAVTVAQTWQPDLILMDVEMPIIDGHRATKQIKDLMGTASPAIMAVTANAFDSNRERMLAAGCDDFLTKPFKTNTLLERIAILLQLEYIYQQNSVNSTTQQAVKQSSGEIRYQLQQMSEDWQLELYQAAIALDYAKVTESLSRIPDSSSDCSATLKKWLEEFRFDKIVKCLES